MYNIALYVIPVHMHIIHIFYTISATAGQKHLTVNFKGDKFVLYSSSTNPSCFTLNHWQVTVFM